MFIKIPAWKCWGCLASQSRLALSESTYLTRSHGLDPCNYKS